MDRKSFLLLFLTPSDHNTRTHRPVSIIPCSRHARCSRELVLGIEGRSVVLCILDMTCSSYSLYTLRAVSWAWNSVLQISQLLSLNTFEYGHDWATSLSCIGEGNGTPLQCSCLESPRVGEAWWAAISGVVQSRTRLKWLSSSSSSSSSRIDSTCHRATKPTHHKCWACALGPMLHNKRSHHNENPMHN